MEAEEDDEKERINIKFPSTSQNATAEESRLKDAGKGSPAYFTSPSHAIYLYIHSAIAHISSLLFPFVLFE